MEEVWLKNLAAAQIVDDSWLYQNADDRALLLGRMPFEFLAGITQKLGVAISVYNKYRYGKNQLKMIETRAKVGGSLTGILLFCQSHQLALALHGEELIATATRVEKFVRYDKQLFKLVPDIDPLGNRFWLFNGKNLVTDEIILKKLLLEMHQLAHLSHQINP